MTMIVLLRTKHSEALCDDDHNSIIVSLLFQVQWSCPRRLSMVAEVLRM